MRRTVDMLLLPGPGRAARYLRVTRGKLWAWSVLALLLSVVAIGAGFIAADAVLGRLPEWASP